MAFNDKGFRTFDFIGTPDLSGAAGTNRAMHAYITNDDTAAVTTANYFNTIASRLKKGDIILMSLDNDGAPMLRNYIVSNIAAGVVTIAAQNVA
jgi:hypothetical protein